jgi:phosphoglycolate phosphatase
MSRIYDHLVFDLDGTLVDSRWDLAAAIDHVLQVLGVPLLPFETIYGFIGEGARRLVQRSLGPAHEHRLEEALDLFLAYYGQHLLDHTRPYPGVAETVAALHARGVILSVLSNKPEALSRAILAGCAPRPFGGSAPGVAPDEVCATRNEISPPDTLSLLPYFTAVIGGDSLPARKPDPSGLRCLSELTGIATERTLLVGDSRIDIETARAAGVAFCGVTWGIRPHEVLAEGARVIECPAQLIAVVERG